MTAIAHASVGELEEIIELLRASNLPTQDVHVGTGVDFLSIRDDGVLLGVIGLERFADAALLRSLAVKAQHQSRGLGGRLIEALEAYCAKCGIATLILLTTTAETFFARRGYEVIARSEAPPSVQASQEFRSLCPASAVCMRKQLTVA